MNYMFVPLDQQFDSGFGMTAEAFRDAAMKLAEREPEHAFLEHLPINFLLRHSIELFLKSAIIIVHRRLKLPYGTECHTSEPRVLVRHDWIPVYRVHSIAVLYEYFRSVFDANLQTLSRIAADVDWTLPKEINDWIAVIEEHDPGSTFFRYPVTKDAVRDRDKSGFQESTVADIFGRMGRPDGPYVKAFFVLDQSDAVKHAYIVDRERGAEVSVALSKTAEVLYGLHAAMRFRVTDGW